MCRLVRKCLMDDIGGHKVFEQHGPAVYEQFDERHWRCPYHAIIHTCYWGMFLQSSLINVTMVLHVSYQVGSA